MQFNDYQAQAVGLADYPNRGSNLLYPALGIAGEAGETVDKIKKLWRNHGVTTGGQLTEEQKLELVKEIGDVLWYIAALSSELNTTLDDVAHTNLRKLYDRRSRDVIRSEGDNR